MKKQLLVSAALVAGLLCFGCSSGATDSVTQIQLSDTETTVNGAIISQDETQAVYTTARTETHADVSADLQGISNTIIHITQAGIYQISGELEDGQLLVDAPEQDVTLILDNATIACQTAPAILIKDANDPQQAGEAGVTITLAESSVTPWWVLNIRLNFRMSVKSCLPQPGQGTSFSRMKFTRSSWVMASTFTSRPFSCT